MYNVIKSIGIKYGINKRWEAVNLNDYAVVDLYKIYRKCYIQLSNGAVPVINCLDIEDVRFQYSLYPGTFDELLIEIGNVALPTIVPFPTINTKIARYRDAFQAGYDVTPVSPIYGVNSSSENLTAVMLTRSSPVIDYEIFHKHCLISINGFYHFTDTDKTSGCLVYDAMKSLRISNQNQVGIYSFEGVCSIELIAIKPEMIHKQDPNEKYSSSTYLQLDKDLTNKSVMLVIGGYLHTVDSGTFAKVGLSDFKIDFSNYQLLDRYFESSKYIDMSSLNLSVTNRNLSQISIQELFSDDKIVAYLTLSQSFFVILDNPDIFTNRQYIKRSNMYGMYISYQEPRYPLVVGLGRHPEYISTLEDGQYSVTIQDNTIQNKIYNTVNPLNLNSVANSNLSINPTDIASGYFLETGKDI